jgi:hypothetical protein
VATAHPAVPVVTTFIERVPAWTVVVEFVTAIVAPPPVSVVFKFLNTPVSKSSKMPNGM